MAINNEGDFSIIQELGGEWKPEGFELCTFRYILEPLYSNNLPSRKKLYELYSDCMAVHEEAEIARAHLWFGLSAFISSARLEPLEKTFKSDVKLEIDGEVQYRKMLVDVAFTLANDSKVKEFIHYVISTKVLKNVKATKFMPPQEKEQNDQVFIPYILDLFKEADKQGVIEPEDLSQLIEWLKNSNFGKFAKKVGKFDPNEKYKRKFTACRKIPGPLQNEGGEESSSEPPLVGSRGIVSRSNSDATEASFTGSERRQMFRDGKQESESGSKDEGELATGVSLRQRSDS